MKDLKTRIIEKLKSPGYQDHKCPMSRRDLLKLGLIAGGGCITPLSFMERIYAQATKANVPFLVFDLEGGASMPGNFLVGQKGGPTDLCATYKQHGWDPRASDSLDLSFGLPMSKKASQMLAGIKQTLPDNLKSENQINFKMGSFCTFTLNDTNLNRISALTLISKAGLTGSYLKNGISQRPTLSGGNSEVYLPDSRFRPTSVGDLNSVLALTSYGEKFERLEPSQRKAIFEQLKQYAGDIPMMRDIYEELSTGGMSEPKMDPRRSAIADVYGLAPDSTGPEALEAGIVYNVLQGHCGPGALTTAGCDYHNNSRTLGDGIDLTIGRSIGRAIHAAYILKRPLFFQIITDGGVTDSGASAENYERIWKADENLHSLSVIGYFNPEQGVSMRKLQVGHYTEAGQLDVNTIAGRSTEIIATGALANYLNVSGQIKRYNDLMGSAEADRHNDEILVFG